MAGAAILVAAALGLPGYASGQTCDRADAGCQPQLARSTPLDVAAVLLPQLACSRRPDVARTLERLVERSVISDRPLEYADSVTYLPLWTPQSIEGLTIVAVFGFDERRASPLWRRGPGTSPGNLFGVVSTNPRAEVQAWVRQHAPGARVAAYEPRQSERYRGATEIACVSPS